MTQTNKRKLVVLYKKGIEGDCCAWKQWRKFNAWCSTFTRKELEAIWKSDLKEPTVAYYQNTDIFPNAFIKGRKNREARWSRKVHKRRRDILARAKDVVKHKAGVPSTTRNDGRAESAFGVTININPDRGPRHIVSALRCLRTRIGDRLFDELCEEAKKRYST
jgi:hypothetical protein